VPALRHFRKEKEQMARSGEGATRPNPSVAGRRGARKVPASRQCGRWSSSRVEQPNLCESGHAKDHGGADGDAPRDRMPHGAGLASQRLGQDIARAAAVSGAITSGCPATRGKNPPSARSARAPTGTSPGRIPLNSATMAPNYSVASARFFGVLVDSL
jgi:hypothetical protein